MSNQDYISRSPAKKKKNNPYKKKPAAQQPSSSIKTKVMTAFAVLLLAAFAYGLWFLKTSPITKIPNQNSPDKVTKKKAKSLPTPPKEKWVYVDALKNKEVEVGQYEVKQGGPYKMQCASFKTQPQAEALKAQMAFIGIESKIQSAQGKHNIWYKVILGPYQRKRLAEEDKHKLRNNKINGKC